MNHLPDKLIIEDLYNKLTAMSGQWYDLSSRVEGLDNRQSEILRVLKTTPGIAAGSLPSLGVNPNGSQESTSTPPTSDGGKSTMEHMPMTRTPDRPTSSGSSGSQVEEEIPGQIVHETLTADEAYERYGVNIAGSVLGTVSQPVEAPGEQPTVWNLQAHLERAHQLITEVMQKIGAGSFSDDLDLARAHINTVMVTEGNKPAPQPEAPAAPRPNWIDSEWSIYINRNSFKVTQQFLSGTEIRQLPTPAIQDDMDLWEMAIGSSDDIKIADSAVVQMRDGLQFFTAPTIINPGRIYLPQSIEEPKA